MNRTNRKRLLDSNTVLRPARVAALVSIFCAAGAYAPAMQAADAPASVAQPKMVLSAYVDAADGENLLAARYDAVIATLGSHGQHFKQDALAASTNLCVAYIMMHRWGEANPACDEAVQFAKLELPEMAQFPFHSHDVHVAAAYSNRAVLESLEHRSMRAADDLAKARALAPDSEFVAQNLARLHAPLTAAGTRSPLRKNASAAATAHG